MINSPDNFLNKYVEYCAKQTDAPSVFHRFLGYLVVSSIVNNKAIIPFGYKKIHPNLYLLIVAPSSAHRKSWSMGIASRLIRKIYPDFLIPDVSSREAFVSELADPQRSPPGCGLLKIDELKGFMDRIRTKSYMEGFIQDLSSLYDGERIDRRKGIDNPQRFKIEEPFINIMAACSNDWLYKSVESGDITGGFFARFLWVVYDRKIENPSPFPPIADDSLEGALITKLARINQFIGTLIFEDCLHTYSVWYKQFYSQNQGGMWDANYHRGALIIQKIAALNALMRIEATGQEMAGHPFLRVSDNDMNQAIAIVSDTFLSFSKITIGVSRFDTITRKVLKKIMDKGITNRRTLLTFCHLSPKILDDALGMLEQAEVIKIEETNHGFFISPTDAADQYLRD